MQTYNQLKKLHEDKVINQQRFFESVAALDNLQRDRRGLSSNLAQANSNLERSSEIWRCSSWPRAHALLKSLGRPSLSLID